jgi:FkbM family methyltransferase
VEELPNHLTTLLSRTEVGLFVDVGAHIGEFALMVRSLGYTGQILSFEPVSENYSRLTAVAASDDRWATQKLALGSKPASMTINVTAQTTLSSFLPFNSAGRSMFGEKTEIKGTETVEVDTLDHVLSDLAYDEVDGIFLKMDTQGYDLEVLEGSADTLPRIKVLQSEVSVQPIYDGMVHWTDAIATYEELGFEVTGLFPVHREEMRVVEFDCVMARPGVIVGAERHHRAF